MAPCSSSPPTGTLTTLNSFEWHHGTNNGWGPASGLVEGGDGWLYGTAFTGGVESRGGNAGMGTVYKVSPNGQLKTLHYFTGTNGELPAAPLVLARDGCLYGTTPYGGLPYANGPPENGYGTLYKITTNGVFTSLFSFSGTNGACPYSGLIQTSDGSFYGTTRMGGMGCGTVFRFKPAGVFTSLFSFTGANGAWPTARLVQGSDGYLLRHDFDGWLRLQCQACERAHGRQRNDFPNLYQRRSHHLALFGVHPGRQSFWGSRAEKGWLVIRYRGLWRRQQRRGHLSLPTRPRRRSCAHNQGK